MTLTIPYNSSALATIYLLSVVNKFDRCWGMRTRSLTLALAKIRLGQTYHNLLMSELGKIFRKIAEQVLCPILQRGRVPRLDSPKLEDHQVPVNSVL
jgi:hypothetical protein